MRLNIVSGEYALGVLGPRLTGDTVPCNEALLTGAVCDDVFSPAFAVCARRPWTCPKACMPKSCAR